MNMNITAEFIQRVLEIRQIRNGGRRLSRRLLEEVPEFILAYECVGNGEDLCDVTPNNDFIASNSLNSPDTHIILTNNPSPNSIHTNQLSPSSSQNISPLNTSLSIPSNNHNKPSPSSNTASTSNNHNKPSPRSSIILEVNSSVKLNTYMYNYLLLFLILYLV